MIRIKRRCLVCKKTSDVPDSETRLPQCLNRTDFESGNNGKYQRHLLAHHSNHYTDAKDIWENVKMILEGSELTKDDRESQLYDEFEHFCQNKGETIQGYYVRFTKLINDMRNIKMTMPRMQLNSKFVNNMLPEWSRFITEVKLNRGLKESNFDQLYAYLKQHEVHANENRIMMERFIQPNNDPLALVLDASVQHVCEADESGMGHGSKASDEGARGERSGDGSVLNAFQRCYMKPGGKSLGPSYDCANTVALMDGTEETSERAIQITILVKIISVHWKTRLSVDATFTLFLSIHRNHHMRDRLFLSGAGSGDSSRLLSIYWTSRYHEMCVVNILNSVNATPNVKIVLNKGKQIWKPKGKLSDNSLNKTKQVWKATGKLFANVGYQWRSTGKKVALGKLNCCYQWRPIGKKFALCELCPLTKLYVQCCSKHITGNRSKLKNFVEKFIGTVRFGNDHFGAIMDDGDYVIGDSVISRVYYVEGLGHNLFSVGQFCDSDLEVAFKKHSCFVRDINGADLLKGSCRTNLYTISIDDMMKSSLICLLSKASKSKSWLWIKGESLIADIEDDIMDPVVMQCHNTFTPAICVFLCERNLSHLSRRLNMQSTVSLTPITTEDGNPARAYIKQALGSFKMGDGVG
ncbi:hypothetical protein Tco_1101533 [Tanacetum coccineum]